MIKLVMTSKLKSDNQKIAEAVNMHGIFFKQAVRKSLEEISNVSILGEEYPVNYLEGGALDLLVQVKTAKHNFILPFECKRARTTTKQWIFFPDPSNYSRLLYSFQKNVCKAQHAGDFTNLGLTICIEGIEVEKQEKRQKDTNYYKADADPIWKAANQISKGLAGIVIDEIKQRNKNPESPAMSDILILPIVVTTAQLFICKEDRENIELSSGNYKKELPLKEVGFTILSHPFTPSQQFGIERLEIKNTEYYDFYNRGRNTKDGIIIVNANHLTDFINLLSKYPYA